MAHVLFVNRDKGVRRVITVFLGSRGHVVSEAGDGDAALQRLQSDRPAS